MEYVIPDGKRKIVLEESPASMSRSIASESCRTLVEVSLVQSIVGVVHLGERFRYRDSRKLIVGVDING